MNSSHGAAAVLCAMLCSVLLLFAGCGDAALPDDTKVIRLWNETAAVYNELAESANRSGWCGDKALVSSFASASAALEQCREELCHANTTEGLEAVEAELSDVAALLASCREAVLLPYDSAELQLYHKATAAAGLYRELCTLICQNGWDYDKATLAMMDSAADTISAAAEALSRDGSLSAEEAVPLLAALEDFNSQGDARRSSFSERWQPPADPAILH